MSSCHVMLYHVISAENVVKVMSDGLGGCNLCQQHMSSCHVVTVGDVDNIGDKKSRPLDVA